MRTFIGLAALFVCAWASPAAAQTCLGRSSFADAPWQARVMSSFSNDSRSFDVGALRGSPLLFAGVNATLTGYSGLDNSAAFVGGTIGLDRGLDARGASSGRVHICPVLTALHQFGPDLDGATFSANVVSLGGRIGIVAAENQTVQVVPTVGMDAQWERDTIESSGAQRSSSATFTVARLGVGFVLDKRTSIVPEIIELFGTSAGTTFRVTATFGFGR